MLPTFDVMTLAGLPPGEPIADRLDYVVRINHRKARMWMETSYTSKQARAAFYASMHQLLWDWVATRSGYQYGGEMLASYRRSLSITSSAGSRLTSC